MTQRLSVRPSVQTAGSSFIRNTVRLTADSTQFVTHNIHQTQLCWQHTVRHAQHTPNTVMMTAHSSSRTISTKHDKLNFNPLLHQFIIELFTIFVCAWNKTRHDTIKVVTLRHMAVGCQRFEGSYCLHLQDLAVRLLKSLLRQLNFYLRCWCRSKTQQNVNTEPASSVNMSTDRFYIQQCPRIDR
jgi:hypothetical protein